MTQASLKIELGSNVAGARHWIREVGRKHVPFATAATLTELAKRGRDRMVETTPRRFTVRSKRFKSTFRIRPAEKRDYPRSESQVGVLDEWVARHERPGILKPERARRLAVPAATVKRTATGKIRKRQRPKEILQGGRGFVSESGVLFETLFASGRLRATPLPRFFLKPKAKLDKGRLELEDTVTREAREHYGTTWRRWMIRSL